MIWRLEKRYQETEFKPFGQEIMAYNINIGKDIPEYLVNFGFLEDMAKKYHLQYIQSGSMNLEGLESFEKIAGRTDTLKKDVGKMSEEERKYSFLNSYFVFQKVESMEPLPSRTSIPAAFKPTSTKPAPVATTPAKPVIKIIRPPPKS